MKKITLFLSLMLIICSVGCSQNTVDSRPIISVSIAPQKTFVEKVCKDKFKIVTLIPTGASAESYELPPKDIKSFADSEIYFSIGVPAEEKGILPHISHNTRAVHLADKVKETYPELKIGNETDPHIWLSVKRVVIMVNEIAKQVSETDPDNKEFYQNNANQYIKELEALDTEVSNILKNRKTNLFFISHPSYGYFADDYGITMVSLEEHGQEATSKELAELTKKAKENNLKTVFCQEETSKKQAELLAKEIGGRVEILRPLSPDYSENLLKTARLIAEG